MDSWPIRLPAARAATWPDARGSEPGTQFLSFLVCHLVDVEVRRAAQVAQVRRTVTKKGRKTVEVVYLITSDRDADPATLAAWVRSHWEIENKLHWVRDVTYQEDKSLVRTRNAPRVMASLRSLAISLLRLDGQTNIAAANRHHARDPQRTLKLLQTA